MLIWIYDKKSIDNCSTRKLLSINDLLFQNKPFDDYKIYKIKPFLNFIKIFEVILF